MEVGLRGGSGRLRGGFPLVGPRGWRGRCQAREETVAGRKRPTAPAAGGTFTERKALRNRHCLPARLPEGARVVMPPGPHVPFPGAWGTFPQTRRPAARSPSEAAVATRTPSGASARTIGTVGIKCQERIAAEPPSHMRRPSSGLRPPSPAGGRRVSNTSSFAPSGRRMMDGIAPCANHFRRFFVSSVSASSMTSTMRSTCWRVRTRGGEMMKVS